MQNEGLKQFDDQLDSLIYRSTEEGDINYAELVGTLTLKAHALCRQAFDILEEMGGEE